MLGQVKDNSGVQTVTQLKIHKTKRKWARPGDQMTVFPRRFKYVKDVKRETYIGLVLVTKRPLHRKGYSVTGPYNGLVLLDWRQRMVGTKIGGLAFDEVKAKYKDAYMLRKVFVRMANRFI